MDKLQLFKLDSLIPCRSCAFYCDFASLM